jgi:hypothetical protein
MMTLGNTSTPIAELLARYAEEESDFSGHGGYEFALELAQHYAKRGPDSQMRCVVHVLLERLRVTGVDINDTDKMPPLPDALLNQRFGYDARQMRDYASQYAAEVAAPLVEALEELVACLPEGWTKRAQRALAAHKERTNG